MNIRKKLSEGETKELRRQVTMKESQSVKNADRLNVNFKVCVHTHETV